MNGNEFLGIFLTRTGTPSSDFPVPSDSSIWHVWKTPVGIYLIQPVDSEHPTIDEVFPLDEESFHKFLKPAHGTNTQLQASAPDLLEVWYQKTKDAQNLLKTSDKLILEEDNGQNSPKQENYYTLPHDIQAKMRDEVTKLHGDQKGPATENLERLLDGLDNFPEKSGEDWHSPVVFTELGVVFRREKNYELALLCHARAHELSPKDERILFNLARTEFELENTEKSRQILKQILKINPNFNVARDFLAFLDGPL